MYKKSFFKTAIIDLVFLFSVSVAQVNNEPYKQEGENWAPNTKAAIDELIKKNSGQKNAYAVFDWDNTSIFGDVQEILFIYQLENLAFKMTPDEFKYSFLHYIDTGCNDNLEIPPGNFDKSFSNIDGEQINISSIMEDCVNDYKFFYENFRTMNSKAKGKLTLDEIKKTDQFKDFKAKMWFTYEALYKSFSGNVAYTWVMYVTVPGFTENEFKNLVVKAIDWGRKRESKKVYFDSPVFLKGKAGVVSNTIIGNYFGNTIQPTIEMGNLFRNLEKNKISVYISTASFQKIVEVVATNSKYGYCIPENRVIGLRLKKNSKGKYLPQYDFTCGYTINSMAGKTVNINNVLVEKYKSNPVMIGGDSDGDYYMITEFSRLNGAKMVNNYNPLQLVLINNRLKSGKIGEICKIAADQLNGKNIGSTKVVLQGHDENTGTWIPTEKTLKLGEFGVDKYKLLP
jgi:hypothetical protein